MAGSEPSPICLMRLKKEIKSLHEEPPEGIFISADEENITLIHALIVGPKDTPYHGGFFYFLLKVPADYPIKPPHVKLMTTGRGKVLFNPNLYSNGKVCLSILGTWWDGPQWSPAQILSTVLLSIQSLMNEQPFFNEPGIEKRKNSGESDRYNELLEHETLRVAVCDMLDGENGLTDSRNLPQSLRDIMERQFLQFYEHYVSVASSKPHLNRKHMKYPAMFAEKGGVFDYASILDRLRRIKTRLEAKLGNGSDLK